MPRMRMGAMCRQQYAFPAFRGPVGWRRRKKHRGGQNREAAAENTNHPHPLAQPGTVSLPIRFNDSVDGNRSRLSAAYPLERDQRLDSPTISHAEGAKLDLKSVSVTISVIGSSGDDSKPICS